jgi:hypothetical protein
MTGLGKFLPIGLLFSLARFLKNTMRSTNFLAKVIY